MVHTHFPDRPIPTTQQDRARLPKAGDPVWLDAPALPPWHQPCRTKIDVGMALLEAARRHTVPLSVLLCDRWSLAEELVAMARSDKKAWVSVLKKHRHLATHRCVLKEAAGTPLPLAGPHLALEDLIPLLPSTAYRAGSVGDHTSGTLPLAVRLPGLGKGRLVLGVAKAALTGTAARLVTNRVEWSAQRLMALSWQRWPIETLYQDGTTPLGLDEYRMRNAEAIEQHWCLVCVAYALLPLDGLPLSPTPGRLPIKTIGEACRQQAQALIEALI